MEERDVELLLQDGMLTLKGEKRSEAEDKDRQLSERYYGRFERHIPLATEVQVRAGDVEFTAKVRIDTPKERDYYKHGGILQFVLRQLMSGN